VVSSQYPSLPSSALSISACRRSTDVLPPTALSGNSKSDAVVSHLALPLPVEGCIVQSIRSNLLGSEGKTSATSGGVGALGGTQQGQVACRTDENIQWSTENRRYPTSLGLPRAIAVAVSARPRRERRRRRGEHLRLALGRRLPCHIHLICHAGETQARRWPAQNGVWRGGLRPALEPAALRTRRCGGPVSVGLR
jgi:hypothetical protein